MKPSSYHSELDMPIVSEQEGVRYLHFGSDLEQGAMKLSDPAQLMYEYTRQMCAFLIFIDPPKDAAIALLGLGAGSLFRFFHKHSHSTLLAVEWNPAVTFCCQEYFFLELREQDVIFHEDAQDWVCSESNKGSVGVLLVDLYDYQAEGPVRDSLEFYKGCADVMDKKGVSVAVFNLFGYHESFNKNLNNIKEAFSDRVLMLEENDDGNQIILAFAGDSLAISGEELMHRAVRTQENYGISTVDMLSELIPNLDQQKIYNF